MKTPGSVPRARKIAPLGSPSGSRSSCHFRKSGLDARPVTATLPLTLAPSLGLVMPFAPAAAAGGVAIGWDTTGFNASGGVAMGWDTTGWLALLAMTNLVKNSS